LITVITLAFPHAQGQEGQLVLARLMDALDRWTLFVAVCCSVGLSCASLCCWPFKLMTFALQDQEQHAVRLSSSKSAFCLFVYNRIIGSVVEVEPRL
jgi:hypothetical protein